MAEEPISLRPLEPLNTPKRIAELLTEISHYHDIKQRVKALNLLWNISNNHQVAEMICAAGHETFLAIVSNEPEIHQVHYITLRILVNLVVPDTNKRMLLEAGAVPILIGLLQRNDPDIRQYVTEFLSELAFYGPVAINEIQEHSGLSYFVDVARSNTLEHQEIGLRAIWHASIFKDAHRKEFAHNTGLQRVLQLYKDSPESNIRQLAYNTLEALAQSRLCRELILSADVKMT